MLTYFLFASLPMLLGLSASTWIKIVNYKYAQTKPQRGISGAEVAQFLLATQGLNDVHVKVYDDFLGNYFDPQSRVLFLSPKVYYSTSLVAMSTAAHEVGHAIQDTKKPWQMRIYRPMVVAIYVGSWLGPLVLFAGLLLSTKIAIWIGLSLFILAAVISLVLVPVESDASRKGKQLLIDNNLLTTDETQKIGRVLNAVNLTQIAVLVQAFTGLLGLIFGSRLFSSYWHPKEFEPTKRR